MDKSILLQKQCRDNSEDLRSYLNDLMKWEEDMKRKESEVDDDTDEAAVPIPRNKSKKIEQIKSKITPKEKGKSKVQKIKSYDYAAWEKFNVEAECDKIDSIKPENNESEDEEPSEGYKILLRDEANYEKERGNQFVKNKKWDEAIACYTHSIACYSKDPIYFANRALCFLKKNDLHSAEADCTSALQLEPSYVKALQRRAAAREGLKQLKEAYDDLKRVLEIEPHNKESKLQLEKLEKKLGGSSFDPSKPSTSKENLVSISTKTADKKEIIISKPSTSKEKILPVSTKSSVNKETNKIDKEIKTRETVTPKIPWPERLSSEIILPVQKLPHQRCKKPLKRIEIEETDTSNINLQVELVKVAETKTRNENPLNFYESNDLAHILSQSNQLNVDEILNNIESDVQKSENKQTTVKANEKPADKTIESLKTLEKETEEIFDFPVPKSSVQFYLNWKMMKNSNKSKFMYLKRIDPKEIPNIFKDSLESDALSGIIFILNEYFIENKLPVYEFLYFLSNVKRFSALTMFLSKADKLALQNIFAYCESANEVAKENLDILRSKYEL